MLARVDHHDAVDDHGADSIGIPMRIFVSRSIGNRLRIEDAVRSLNYIPNHLASALASTRTHIVGCIVPSLTNGVFDNYLNAIQDVLVSAGIQMLVLNSRYNDAEEERAIETLLGYHPEAMIVIGVDQTERSRELLKNSGIPVIQALDLTDNAVRAQVRAVVRQLRSEKLLHAAQVVGARYDLDTGAVEVIE